LYRYTTEPAVLPGLEPLQPVAEDLVGLYELNSVDPQRESAWFQPLKL
jgi:hypothetical protein